MRANELRQARYRAGNPNSEGSAGGEAPLLDAASLLLEDDKAMDASRRDFFGRVIGAGGAGPLREIDGNGNGSVGEAEMAGKKARAAKEVKVWVTYHEGFSNAVKKPITVAELLRGL